MDGKINLNKHEQVISSIDQRHNRWKSRNNYNNRSNKSFICTKGNHQKFKYTNLLIINFYWIGEEEQQ